MERNANHVFEVEINCVGSHRVGEPIERLLQRSLEFSEDSYDFVNSLPVQQTAWPPNDQTNVFAKLDVWWKLHVVHSVDSPRVVRGRWLRRQQFERDTEPLRGFFAILEYANVDRRTLSQ